jgi:hypothetical protein
LTTALFTIFLALSAYLNVDRDSSKLMEAGDIAQIIIVFEFPPNAFYKILVRAESLYGTTVIFSFPHALSARILIHVPNTVKLLLIAQPSFNLYPSAPVYPAFSDPARSTKLITENFSTFLSSSSIIYLNSIVIIVCALLLV